MTFPQLSSGAVAQFPFRRTARFRTLENEMDDGSTVGFTDVDFEERRWEIPLRELSDAEWNQLKTLFEQSEGRLQGFTFLEPGANLVSFSEALSTADWQKDGGIGVTDGQPDPVGGNAATTVIASSGGLTVSQVLNAPASYLYAGSVWARTNASGAALRVSDGGALSVEEPIASDNVWRRYTLAFDVPSAAAQVELAIVAPNGTLNVYGPQLEAQLDASAYKKNGAGSGVYENARFDQDSLADVATGPGRHSTTVRIVWTPSQT